MPRPLLRAALALALALPSLTALAAPPSTKAFPFPMQTETLPNGLRVVLIKYDSPGLAAYYTLMRVGSRNEAEPGRSGYAHFFEHMMFRGTKKHSGDEYNATVTKLGLSTNAFTSEDMTVYHLFGKSDALPTIIEYEADRFQNLEYSEAQFKTEAGAILGEYAKSASNPEQQLEEKMLETAFSTHTYRHTVIGYLADVKAMPSGYTYSREFFRRYYTPDNATVIVVGDFDAKKTLELVRTAYSGWAGKLDPVAIPTEPAQRGPRRVHVEWKSPTLPRLWMGWHAPGAQDGDLKAVAAQNILAAYMFGPTSPLYQELVLERQIADSLEPAYGDHRDPNLFGVFLKVKRDWHVAAAERSVLAEVSKLAQGDVDVARLTAVRSNLKYQAILQLNTADRIAVTLAVTTAQTGDLEYLNRLYATVDALEPAELVKFARAYLTDANRATATLATRPTALKTGAR